jgi:hypothetical protein
MLAADLFQPIENELMKLIQVNNLPRFIGTPSFNLCALILNRAPFKLKNQIGLTKGIVSVNEFDSVDAASATVGSIGSPVRTLGPRIAVAAAAAGTSPVTHTRGGTALGGFMRGVDITSGHIGRDHPDEPSIDRREYSAAPLGHAVNINTTATTAAVPAVAAPMSPMPILTIRPSLAIGTSSGSPKNTYEKQPLLVMNESSPNSAAAAAVAVAAVVTNNGSPVASNRTDADVNIRYSFSSSFLHRISTV